MTIKEQILDFLRTQKMSTEEVSDALGKTGCIEGLYPVNNGHYAVGEVQYVYAHNNSNYSIHEQIRDIEAGKIDINADESSANTNENGGEDNE